LTELFEKKVNVFWHTVYIQTTKRTSGRGGLSSSQYEFKLLISASPYGGIECVYYYYYCYYQTKTKLDDL